MTLATILSRRSIRHFQDQAVDAADLEALLRAAMAAPSAGNQQPWQFVVIHSRADLDAIPTIHPHAAMTREAPLAILVCGDLGGARYPDFWVQDCAAATENLLLAAHSLGLGAVWCGIYPNLEWAAAFRERFGIPEAIRRRPPRRNQASSRPLRPATGALGTLERQPLTPWPPLGLRN